MALDTDVLSELMVSNFVEEKANGPDEVQSREAEVVPLEDGSSETNVTEETGPPDVKPEDIRPLMSAISKAIVDHLTENAFVEDTDATYGGNWRIK